MFDQALKVAEGIEEARERAWALREIAGEMANGRGSGRGGQHRGAGDGGANGRVAIRPFGVGGRARKGDGRSKEGFLKLLPWCGWSLKFAYQACGLLAWLYPERGGQIAEIAGVRLARTAATGN
jgi:hypothetical protein